MGNFFTQEDSPYYVSGQEEQEDEIEEDFLPASKQQLQDKAGKIIHFFFIKHRFFLVH